MTLTRLLPTLRRSIPDPIAPAQWPAGTRVTTTDVIVGGFSMVRLAERSGTPLAHLDPAPAAADGVDHARHLGVVLATVQSVTNGRSGDAAAGGQPEIAIDARFGPHRPGWAEARLIGRVSVARVSPVTVRFAAGGCHVLAPVELPGDLVAGDLIAVPIEAHAIRFASAADGHSAAASGRLREPALRA
ncbi:hypothetical protein MUN74_11695 [Agromyces endophyticus]|uniref:hypothetical protein n=1 Tax=Agromyces sp. H17E-10 TaxID=2932244 RepID=UPI001FD2E8E0|nr:hypothetical protein [Agromyces sp. H17E-10]UOQ87959.1 hypothetical protein MUN74_11695 [Agromyces sp. H17E-10]